MPTIKGFLVICKQCQSPHINMRVNHHIENPVMFDLEYDCTACHQHESTHFDPPIINRKEVIQQMEMASKVAYS